MLMYGGNFTHLAQRALMKAQSIAEGKGHQQIDALHLLDALLGQEESIVLTLLTNLGVDLMALREKTRRALEIIPTIVAPAVLGQFYLTQDLAKVLDWARREAMKMDDEFISVEHLFLALLATPTKAKEILEAARYLQPTGGSTAMLEGGCLDYQTALRSLSQLRGESKVTDPNPESKYQVVEQYALNLTQLAKRGRLDPVIGRENEIQRLMQVLSRRTKNNPVLIGEAGVGKTAIVEGLAQKIVRGEVPESLKEKELISLDLGALVAGTRYRGEFESRIKSLLREIKRAAGKYILFIDELHTLVGAGAAEGAIDASSLLKPTLARGELHAIGATTLKEYQRYVEHDPALERRFQPIYVSEPTLEDTIAILRGIKEKYELHHGVKIEDEALKTAVELASRYINDRFLPDKAIDLMDEAASALRLRIESKPQTLETLEQEMKKLKVEKESLLGEEAARPKRRVRAIERTLADLAEKHKALELKWRGEKDLISQIKDLKKKVDSLQFEAELAQRENNLQKVAEIQYGRIPESLKEIRLLEKKLTSLQKKKKVLQEEVGSEDIAKAVSRWTGIPVTRLVEAEAKKLKKMEIILQKRVVGQMEAISAVSRAIRRSRAGVAEEKRPAGSFMFLGPSGCGKTELARALAEFLFNDEDALVRLDMSEYTERHAISKMIGSPPGYVGYDEGGQLTEKLRRRPYCVVLFDEIEKAHPEVFNLFLQILEDGRLTDAKGRVVSFKNAILIMTSNIGSEYINQLGTIGFLGKAEERERQTLKEKVRDSLRESFRPEFLNRIDEIVIFNYLGRPEIRKIVDLELEKVAKRSASKRIKLIFTLKAKEFLAKQGFDVNSGARPLKRVIQKMILDPLALMMVAGEVGAGDRVTVEVKGDRIVLSSSRPALLKESELVEAET